MLAATSALAVPAGAWASSTLAVGTITDAGPDGGYDNPPYGPSVAVDNAGDVLYLGDASDSSSGPSGQVGGMWRDGAFVQAPVPSGYHTVFIEYMNAAGMVVGTASNASNNTSAGYFWDTVTNQVTLSSGSGNCGSMGIGLVAIDDAGEAGGGEGCTSGAYGVTVSSAGQTAQPVADNSTEISAIQPNWMLDGIGSGVGRINRQTNAEVPVPIEPSGENALAPDGSVVGTAVQTTQTTVAAPQIMLPDGSVLTLPGADGYAGTGAGINASGEIVGRADGEAVIWPSYTQQPIAFKTLLPTGSGWGALSVSAISANGTILGSGLHNGSLRSFVFVPGSPDLSASIALTDAQGQPFSGPAKPGTQLNATVTLTEAASASYPITDISVDANGLTVTPSSALTYISGGPSGPLSLNPGQSTSYTVSYTVAGTGTANLAVDASGTENGSAADASASVTARLTQPLSVAVSFLQNGTNLAGSSLGSNTIRLQDADSGEIPQDVTAELKVTNQTGVTETNITINGVPALSYHNPADALQQLPIAVSSGPGVTPASGGAAPSMDLANLAPGQSETVDYTLHVSNNGVFDFSPQLLSSDSVGTNQVSSGAGTITALPTALLWLALHADTSQPLAPGGRQYVSGEVTNRSLTQSIDVYPLLPSSLDGNVGGGALADISDPTLSDGIVVPFMGVLKPGQTVDVGGWLQSSTTADTTGEATYDPLGTVISGGTETLLTPTQIGTSADSSPIDVTIGTAQPLVGIGDDTYMGNFTSSAATGLGIWALDQWQGAKKLLTTNPITTAWSVGKGIAAFAENGKELTSSAAYLVASVYGYATALVDLDQSQRNQVEAQIVADYDSTAIGKLVNLGVTNVQQIFDSIETAGNTGDYAKLGQIFGTGVAHSLTGIADAVLAEFTFQKLSQGMKVATKAAAGAVASQDGFLVNGIKLQASIEDAKVSQVLGKGIAGLVPGMNLLLDSGKVLADDFGLTSKQVTELINYCKRSDLIIAVRQRSAKAAELIRKGLAVAKNEVIKIKAVSSVDTEFLGYASGDVGTVMWAEPVDKSFVQRKLSQWEARNAGNPNFAASKAAVEQEVWARHKIRVDEWNNTSIRRTVTNGDVSKSIDWGFNGSGNGAPRANKQIYRRFDLEKAYDPTGSSGRVYQRLLVGNKPGLSSGIRLVPISQDVDVMAILKANGELLSPEERAAAYGHLMNVVDMQHGETPTWIMDGEIMFQKKAKQLADVVPGGEPLAVFNPQGGVTSGFFDPALTVFDNANMSGRIFFKGGYNDPYSLLKVKISLAAKNYGAAT
jgi:hypothetical protein